jgi:hypothetical protein
MALQLFVGPWSLLQLRNLFTQTVGLLGRVINPPQIRYPHRTEQTQEKRTNIHSCLEWYSNSRSQRHVVKGVDYFGYELYSWSSVLLQKLRSSILNNDIRLLWNAKFCYLVHKIPYQEPLPYPTALRSLSVLSYFPCLALPVVCYLQFSQIKFCERILILECAFHVL